MVSATSKQLRQLVTRRHPEFDEKQTHWQFLYNTYISSPSWFRENIFQFVREGPETYSGRLKRAYRFNHTREVVDLVNKYLFKNPPIRRESVPDSVLRFRARATQSGLTLDEFERQVSRMASIVGRVYIVVDNNALGVETLADEKKGKVGLYAYIVMPWQFLDCGFDENGEMSWCLIHEEKRDDSNPFESSGEIVDHYRLWTKTDWQLYKGDIRKGTIARVDLVDQRAHNLGVLPVIKCDHIETDSKYTAPALIEDIAYLDRAVANYCSNLDQIINDQTFSQLTMPVQGTLPGVSTESGETIDDSNDPDFVKARKQIMRMGTSQVLLYDGEAGNPPSYISPDPKQAQMVVNTIRQIINEIYHTVGLAGERTKQDNSMGIDNSSGVAKAFDFERVNALLTAKSASMEQFSNRIENLVRVYNNEEVIDGDAKDKLPVVYSTNFDIRGLNDELAIAAQFSLLSVPMEIRRFHMKSLLGKIWPMLSDEDKKKLETSIANWEDILYTSPTVGSSSSSDDPLDQKTTQGFPGNKPEPNK